EHMYHTQLNPYLFFFSSRRRHTRSKRDWSSDVCSSDLQAFFQHQSTIIHREHIRFLSQTTKQTETIHDEEAMIERAILETHGNLSKAAKIIGISRSTIYRKLNDYPRLKQLREDFKSRTD